MKKRIKRDKEKILLTGGAGFIGSQMARTILASQYPYEYELVVVDKLTYAGNRDNLPKDCDLRVVDIRDCEAMDFIFSQEKPHYVINMAAESHVDNSILDASPFISTNVLGTQILLDLSLKHGVKRFAQISTDEVYNGNQCLETPASHLNPSSPYAASKASADLLVLAYHKTHGLDVIITRCCNNFGPRQHKEKFIPTVINAFCNSQTIPVYGTGKNIRQWIYVEDHCKPILSMLKTYQNQEKIYHLGSALRISNLEMIGILYDIFNKVRPDNGGPMSVIGGPKNYIEFVTDRKGHDTQYWLDDQETIDDKVIDFTRRLDFQKPLEDTVTWYIEQWIKNNR